MGASASQAGHDFGSSLGHSFGASVAQELEARLQSPSPAPRLQSAVRLAP